jgi:glycine dehydrogenase
MAVEPRTLSELEQRTDFTRRHIGPDAAEQQSMLQTLNAESLDDLMRQTVPSNILLDDALSMSDSETEVEALNYLQGLARQNKVNKSYIGMGYHNTQVPIVILRNVLENPGWYTAYTPYQPEIAQGRLEALLN